MNKLFILLVLVFVSCVNNNIDIPDNVLSEKQMVEIIADLQRMEAVHKNLGLMGVQKKHVADTSFAIVFNKHEVKASDFDSSYNFYTLHPKLFEQIIEKVEEELNQEL